MGQVRDDDVRDFVVEALRVGLMLSDLLSGILDDLPEDAFPGEDPAEVLIAMLTGSVVPVGRAAGPRTVRQATALLGAMADRTIDDLRAAAERARPG
jgi:hypothetical protein